MMKISTPFKQKKSRRPRRSERRLGKAQVMESRSAVSAFAVRPALTFWQMNNSRIIGLLTLLLLVWIGYLLFRYDAFYVYAADIQGNHILGAEEIYAASQVHTLSVFWIDPKTVENNVENLPAIKNAQVKVTLPANVRIKVEERQPEVVWQSGEDLWWIDNEGTFVTPKEGVEAAAGRLRIVDTDERKVRANDTIDTAIIRGAQIIHEQKLEVEQIYHSEYYGLYYFTPAGWPVILGKASNIPAKLAVADAMIFDLQTRQITPAFIDVRNPRRAVYKTKDER
jgi:cell division septal protein FtsQ